MNLEHYTRNDMPKDYQGIADNLELLDTHWWKGSIFKSWFNINKCDLFVTSYIGAPIKVGKVEDYDLFEPTSFICVQNPNVFGDLSAFHTLASHNIGSDQRPWAYLDIGTSLNSIREVTIQTSEYNEENLPSCSPSYMAIFILEKGRLIEMLATDQAHLFGNHIQIHGHHIRRSEREWGPLDIVEIHP